MEQINVPADRPAPDPRRWLALIFIGLALLMTILDATVVNIALPSLQEDLGISDGDRQWAITAYTLAFGSLLFLGGRIADYTGRKRAFLVALLGFAGASALGGAAPDFEMLLAARALQGAFGALLAPAMLSLVAVNFTTQQERAKAFGIFGALAVSGAAIGLLTGGALTEYLDWRWCLYINIPIALIAAAGGWALLRADPRRAGRIRFDIPGVLLVTGGLVAIVYACSAAESGGWDSAKVIALLAAGAVLLAAFALVESRVAGPLLPLRVIAHRTRGAACLAVTVTMIAMFGGLLLNTYYLQVVKGYSPIKTGLAFLPMATAVLLAVAALSIPLLPRVPPRALVVPGMLLAAAGMIWLTTVEAGTGYTEGVLAAMVLMGFGVGLVMPVAENYATYGVGEGDSGVAAASVHAAQQIGGSVATALLNTIAASATVSYLAAHGTSPAISRDALVNGFATAGGWGGATIVVGALLVGVLMNAPRPARHPAAESAGPLPAQHR